MQARWRIQCYGRVQHVGFRYTALRIAKKLELTGWVRNLPDGSVLLEAQGGTAQLRKFYLALKSQPHLHIEKTDISEIPPRPDDGLFRVVDGWMD